MQKKIQKYILFYKRKETKDTFIFRFKPEGGNIFPFVAGQYCFLQYPQFKDPKEVHPFSIASTPLNKSYLEFCIKIAGDWTAWFCNNVKIGNTIFISHPQGDFTWNQTISQSVFLSGGIGIAPFISMLKTIVATKQTPHITLIYGNQTLKTVAYKQELNKLRNELPHLKIVHVFSHLTENHPWRGYRGFITSEIIKKEVDLTKNPTFFLIGPPVFIEFMNPILKSSLIEKGEIKSEKLLEKKFS